MDSTLCETDSASDPGLIASWRSDGRGLLTVTALGLLAAGVFAWFLAVTDQLLPHDLDWLSVSEVELRSISDGRLVHFMAHGPGGRFSTVALSRANGKARHRLTRAWKIVAWVVAATILGLAIDLAASSLCDEACRIALRADPVRSPPGLITYLLLAVGTVGITILVDGWGDNLRRRASRG